MIQEQVPKWMDVFRLKGTLTLVYDDHRSTPKQVSEKCTNTWTKKILKTAGDCKTGHRAGSRNQNRVLIPNSNTAR